MLATVRDNLAHTRDLALFEMAMTYRWRKNDLPEETPHLVMALTSPTANAGEATALFFKAKGILETLVRDVLHISDVGQPNEGSLIWLDESYRLPFGQFGSVGLVAPEIRSAMGIRQEVALVRLRVSALIAHASRQTSFVPIPKYPPVVEDMTFVIDRGTRVSDLITVLRHADPHVADVSFVSLYGENVRTVRVTYQHPEKTLTNEAIVPIRKKLLVKAETIGATLKTT
jgi:phenylalanyl-tRNA synthetase beta subunit